MLMLMGLHPRTAIYGPSTLWTTGSLHFGGRMVMEGGGTGTDDYGGVGAEGEGGQENDD